MISRLVLPIALLAAFFSFSQTNISLSAKAGLAVAKENYGQVILAEATVINKNNGLLEAAYTYADMYNTEEISNFHMNKYSLRAGYAIFSENKKFSGYGKMGPALMYLSGFDENNKPKFGFDIGFESSYVLWEPLEAVFGIMNSFNKATTNFAQFYCGFRLNFGRKNDSE